MNNDLSIEPGNECARVTKHINISAIMSIQYSLGLGTLQDQTFAIFSIHKAIAKIQLGETVSVVVRYLLDR